MMNKNYGEDSCDLEPPFNILTTIQHLILENNQFIMLHWKGESCLQLNVPWL